MKSASLKIAPASRHWWKYKARALLISLSISALFITTLTIILLTRLYPTWSLFMCDSGWQGLRIVMAVDLVLGPIIAFVIFSPNKSKRHLIFDICTVVLIQAGAFSWGCYSLWTQHPVALVYKINQFKPIFREDLKKQHVTSDYLNQFSNSRPLLIFSKTPTDFVDNFGSTIRSLVDQGVEPQAVVGTFDSIHNHLDEMFSNQTAFKKALETTNPNALALFSQKKHASIDDLRIVPVNLRNGDAVFVFNKEGALLGDIIVRGDFDSVAESMLHQKTSS